MWIEPSSFVAAAGERLAVHLKVGERWQGEPVRRDARRIVRFFAAGSGGPQTQLAGVDGADPAGSFSAEQAGFYWLGYRTNQARIELAAEKFESYLREEGHDAALAERERRGEGAQPGRELYSRCVKALIAVGDAGRAADEVIRRPLGLELEIVPETNPFAGAGEMRLRIDYAGEPAAGLLVQAVSKSSPETPLRARTDSAGRVSFPLSAGAWLVTATHMKRISRREDAEWESLWASLTFEAVQPATVGGKP